MVLVSKDLNWSLTNRCYKVSYLTKVNDIRISNYSGFGTWNISLIPNLFMYSDWYYNSISVVLEISVYLKSKRNIKNLLKLLTESGTGTIRSKIENASKLYELNVFVHEITIAKPGTAKIYLLEFPISINWNDV